MSGLRANQAALSLVSSNVANVETPGYVRKSVNQVQTTTGTGSAGVTVTGVNRATGELSQQLRERHDASDFETKTQDKLEAAK